MVGEKDKEIPIIEAVAGMIASRSIRNRYGGVVVAANTVLDLLLLRKIKRLGIKTIFVYIMKDNVIDATLQRFTQSYDEARQEIKELIKAVGDGKPLSIEKVRKISGMIINKYDNNRQVFQAIAQFRNVDEYTYTHNVNVALLCSIMAKWLRYDDAQTRLLIYAGLLHDIGKARMPHDILNKPGKLTESEFEIMKQHTHYGYEIIKKMSYVSNDVATGALLHHERGDGGGYPLGLEGSKIPSTAKIIALADIYDAMTSERVYKSKQTPFSVLELFENHSFGVLDTRYLMVFMQNIAQYYIGDMITLNTGQKAEVIHVNPQRISRPLIRIADEGRFVDLVVEQEYTIIDHMTTDRHRGENIVMQTDRCILQQVQKKDEKEVRNLYQNALVRKYLGGRVGDDAFQQSFSKMISREAGLYLTVRRQKGHTFLGLVSIDTYHDGIHKEVSYQFLPEFWGKGYAKEVVVAMISFAFTELKLQKLIAETQRQNTASCMLLESVGMKCQGVVERFGAQQCVYSISCEESRLHSTTS